MMSIEQEILNWDGKSSSDIGEVYNRHCNDDNLPKTLLRLSNKTELQRGATWLLKHFLADGKEMEPNDVAALVSLVPILEYWESKLHILQCLPYLSIAKSQHKAVELFLRKCITDANKFVRAWAYNGFYELACQYPEHKPEVLQFFDMAMRDEAASVKARIRQVMKKGFEHTSSVGH